MATDEWSDVPVLNGLTKDSQEYSFFQAVRLLEGYAAQVDKPLALKFQANNTLAIRPAFIEHIAVKDESTQVSAEITTNGFHLLGQQGPVPSVYSEMVTRAAQNGNKAPTAFVDVFNGRILQALYDVKRKFSPLLFGGVTADKTLLEPFEAISGVDFNSLHEQLIASSFSTQWRGHSSALANRRINYSMFKQTLAAEVGGDVSIAPGCGGWLNLGAENQAALDGNTRLGNGQALGRRYWSHSAAIKVTLCFKELEAYETFLPGGVGRKRLIRLLAILSDLRFGVLLVMQLLNARHKPAVLNGHARLGLTTWLSGVGDQTVQSNWTCSRLNRSDLQASLVEDDNVNAFV
jgi:type VI secretion system protein ImpH